MFGDLDDDVVELLVGHRGAAAVETNQVAVAVQAGVAVAAGAARAFAGAIGQGAVEHIVDFRQLVLADGRRALSFEYPVEI